jgi:hypothetical protein
MPVTISSAEELVAEAASLTKQISMVGTYCNEFPQECVIAQVKLCQPEHLSGKF